MEEKVFWMIFKGRQSGFWGATAFLPYLPRMWQHCTTGTWQQLMVSSVKSSPLIMVLLLPVKPVSQGIVGYLCFPLRIMHHFELLLALPVLNIFAWAGATVYSTSLPGQERRRTNNTTHFSNNKASEGADEMWMQDPNFLTLEGVPNLPLPRCIVMLSPRRPLGVPPPLLSLAPNFSPHRKEEGEILRIQKIKL